MVARWVTFVLGVWMILAAFVLPHATQALAWNDLATGTAIAISALVGIVLPDARYASAGLGSWLILTPYVLSPANTSVLVNDVCVGVAVLFASLFPTFIQRPASAGLKPM